MIQSATQTISPIPEGLSSDATDRFGSVIEQNATLGKMPAHFGNDFTIIDDYQGIIDAMVNDIDQATTHIYLEYYAVVLDNTTRPLFSALERATARGVKVFVLFDAVGTRKYAGAREMQRELTRIGAKWHKILPLELKWGKYNRPDLRNHRKLTIIDDSVAYIGSLNLISRDYQRKDSIIYDELAVRMTGPVARQAAAVFSGDWMSETDQVPYKKLSLPSPNETEQGGVLAQLLPSGPSYEYQNNLKLFVSLLYKANEKIVITNPYFVPDDALLTAIITAAKRGVEVILINSQAKDQWMVGHAQRSYYLELLEAGVKIYLHRAPVLLHSKHITIDNDIAVIGSSNMDIRSFQLNLECVVVAYDTSVVDKLETIQRKNIADAKLVSLDEWRKRSLKKSLLDSVARLTSALQ